ncbi:MAG: gliding motility-associated C-terminal domain-containing protein, partial [Bacteroidota bacterium]
MNNRFTIKAGKSMRWIAFLLVAWCSISDSYATHMAGGDIEYTCIGPRKWAIKLTVYRYCDNGAAWLCSSFSCPQTLTATPSPQISAGGINPNGCVSNPSSVSTVLQLQSVEDVGKGNIVRCGTSAKNSCDNLGQVTPGGYKPSIERYTFTGILDLSIPSLGAANACPYWDIGWSYCCRNSTVNVQGQPQFYIQGTINILDRSGSPCINNSPVMKNEPVAIFCAGQEYIFNMGAVDPDRDSLSYEIIKSLQAANTVVPYNTPFSERWPFPLVTTSPPHSGYPGQPFVVLDSANGDLALNASNPTTQPIGGDISVRITQWSYEERPVGSGNYVPFIVGITMRNLQIYSIPCLGNNPPRFSTSPSAPNGGPRYNWTTCAGDKICFQVTAKDTDFKPNNSPPRIDTTFLSWNQSIVRGPGKVSFKPIYNPATPPRPREDAYEFCWQTEESDGSTLPYYLTIQGEDNFCPNPGRVIRAFSIKVQPKPKVSFIADYSLRCGKIIGRMYKVDVRQNLTFAQMEIAKSPYDYAFIDGAYTKTTFTANPTGSGTSPRIIFADTIQFKLGGKYLVKITARSPGAEAGTFCETILFDTISVDTVVQAFAKDTFVCKFNTVPVEAKAQWGTGPYSYRWFRNNTSGQPVNGPNFLQNRVYTAGDTVQTKYILRVQDAYGCFSLDSMILSIKQLPRPTIMDSLRICSYDSLKIDGGNNSGNIRSYAWYKNGNLLAGETGQSITRNDSGRFVQLMTDTFGCQMYDTIKLFVNLPVTAYAGQDTSVCPGDTVTIKGTGGYKYEWKQMRTIGAPFTIKIKNYVDSVRVAPGVTTDYLLTAYLAYPDSSRAYKECFHTDTVRVSAKQQPNITRPTLITACSSTDSIYMPFVTIGPASQIGGIGKWSYRAAPGGLKEVGSNTLLFVDSLGKLPADTIIANMANNGELVMKRFWVKYSYRGPVSEGACLREDSLEIKVYPLPKIDAGADQSFCTTGSSYLLNTNASIQYASPVDLTGKIGVWSVVQGGGLTSSGTNNITYTFNPNPAAPGGTGLNIFPNINRLRYTYTLNYNIPSQLSCVNFDNADFTVRQPPKLTIGAPGKAIRVCRSDPEFEISLKAIASSTTSIPGSSKWYAAPPGSQVNISQAIRDSLFFNPGHGQVPNAGGTWKLYYRDIASGCEVKDSLNLTVIASPVVTLSPDKPSLCQSDPPLTMTTTSTVSDPGVFSGPGISQTGEFNAQAPAVIPGNNHTIVYSVTTAEGCTGTDTSVIYVQKQPVLTVLPVDPKCNYDSISPFLLTSTVTPDFGVKWSTDGTGKLDNDTILTPKYTFTTSDANQRLVKATVIITRNGVCPSDAKEVIMDIHPKPNAAILGDSLEGCAPLTFYMGAAGAGIGGSTYKWFVDDMSTVLETDSAFSRTITGWGNYNVRLVVETPAKCTNFSDTVVRVRAIPVADFDFDPKRTTIARPFFSFNNKSTVGDGNPMDYIWNFGPDPTKPTDTITPRINTESNPRNIQFPASDGKILVTLRAISKYNGYECAHDTFRYVEIDPDITVFIPSAFRPVDGGNGVPCADPTFSDCNDVFRVYADGFATIEVFVFNRWGQQVFSTNNPDIGWNGKVKNSGEVCPQDVYIYQI